MGRLGAWAADRQISPGTLHGISLLLAFCAAIWFSGGIADRGAGLLALLGAVLAMAGGGRLAAFMSKNAVRPRPAARRRSDADESTDWLALPDVPWGGQAQSAVQPGVAREDDRPTTVGVKQGGVGRLTDDDGDADIVVVSRDAITPDVPTADDGEGADGTWADGASKAGAVRFGRWPSSEPDAASSGATASRRAAVGRDAVPDRAARAARGGTASSGATASRDAAGRQPVARSSGVPGAAVGARSYGWIAAVSAAAAESAIYGGLAAGGGPARPIGMWPLAVLTIAAIGTADLLGACRVAAVDAAIGSVAGETPWEWVWPRRLPGLPRGARLLLAGLALLLAGPQAGLLAVLGAELLALACMLAALGRIAPAPDGTAGGSAARARRRRAGGTRGGGAAVLGAMGPTAPGAAADESGTRTRVTALVGVDGPAGTTAVRIITSARATKTARGQFADADAAGPAAGDEDRDAGSAFASEAAPAGAADGSILKAGTALPTRPDPADLASADLASADLASADLAPAEVAPAEVAPAEVAPAGSAPAGPAWPLGSAGEQDDVIPVGGVAGSVRSAQQRSDSAAAGYSADPVDQVNAADSPEPADVGLATGDPVPGGQAPGGAGTRYPGVRTAGESSHRPPGGVLGLRDDGAAALWAGRLVQGNLIPLPPALAGLVATAMLAALGLRNLHGIVAMTPPIVMMLAAPGSSHPHDGRFDWLVPGLLVLAQYVYLGALGFAVGVPGPVVFAACALTGLWYVSLAARGPAANGPAANGAAANGQAANGAAANGQAANGAAAKGSAASDVTAAEIVGLATPRRAWDGVGWEVRLFLTGLAVTFGLGTFGYVGLAAYLGVLLVRQAANRHRYLTRVEDDGP